MHNSVNILKTQGTVHFKWVNFMVCKFYLDKTIKKKKRKKTSLKQFKLISSDFTACQNKVRSHLQEYKINQCPQNIKSPMPGANPKLLGK